MKPLARWTIGPVEPIGYEILKHSVIKFGEVYPEFDRVVCFNNIDKPDIDCDLINQHDFELQFQPSSPDEDYSLRSGGMKGSGWKLAPPRLRIESHELWIDNDIVILERMPEIDQWIQKQTSIISEGLGQHYGSFKSLMGDIKMCAGFFGLPPKFDFESKISELQKDKELDELGGFDEQGLVAYIVSQIDGFITVPKETLKIVEDHHEFPSEKKKGYHFVGANRKNWHRGWKSFLEL